MPKSLASLNVSQAKNGVEPLFILHTSSFQELSTTIFLRYYDTFYFHGDCVKQSQLKINRILSLLN